MEIYSPLHVIMMNEQRGVVVGRAGFSLRSSEPSLKQDSGAEMSINMHIKSDPSAGGILSLAEERKVKLAYIRMMAGVPEDRPVFSYLSLVGSQRLPKSPLIGFDFCLRGDRI